MDLAIKGRALYQPGPWGSKRPLRKSGQATVWLMNRTGPVSFATANIGQDGWFLITFPPPAALVTDFYIEIHETCTGEKHMHRVSRPPNPRAFALAPDDVGNIEVPWEPPDAELAYVESTFFKDTRLLAKKLCSLLRSPSYPITMALIRESVDGTGKDYTPAQNLLIPLKAPRANFAKYMVNDIDDEIVSTRSATINDSFADILERFSMVDIKGLEEGKFLNRFLAIIQRAFATSSYSENMMTEPAHDMAAACFILFVGGLMKKDKANPTITFRSSSYLCSSGRGSRVMCRIVVSVSRS